MMKLLELTRAHTKSKVAFNIKHIVHIEPVIVTNKDYTGDGKTYVNTLNSVETMVTEDYETIMRMLVSL